MLQNPRLQYLTNHQLTVVFRDDSPLVYANDSPTYRSVHINLTDSQIEQLAKQYTHSCGNTPFFESISKCFIEEKPI